MRKALSITVAFLLTLSLISATAEGLLPTISDVIGVEMPSLYDTLERYPDAVEDLEDGSASETWLNVTQDEYAAFGNSLGKSGCAMAEYHTEGTLFVAQIEKEGRFFTFEYDAADGKATLIYPVGTVDAATKAAEDRYQIALQAIEAGDYDAAARVFMELRGYRDVDNLLENDDNLIAVAAEAAAWREQSYVGNTVTLGHYEQDGDTSNGTEAIEWIVLANDGEKATLISKYGLDAKPYNEKREGVTWETCTLRKWLNGEFLNAAFSAKEQAKLAAVAVTADKNPEYSTDPGNDTQDTVFLLSIDEVNRYFKYDAARVCMPTKTAVANGANTNDSDACWWWLRSPGVNSNCTVGVDAGGSVRDIGYSVTYDNYTVRPVVVLRLS